jgi:signal peptidase I
LFKNSIEQKQVKFTRILLMLGSLTAIFTVMYAVGKRYTRHNMSFVIPTGESMLPTLPESNAIFRLDIPLTLERGDIVTLTDDQGEMAEKRIIGLPHDLVDITNGHVYINRQLLYEPYLAKGTYTKPMAAGSHIRLAQDQYLVMGDNRGLSYDGRCYGPRPRSAIIARLQIFTQPPTTNVPTYLKTKI